MGWLDDALDFEMFNAKDIWKKIKKDPERLLIGADNPWNTKVWNSVLGSNYEPFVDQMGGAYGGHTISAFGNQTGGVYGRAQLAGINTLPASSMHDLAHVISAMYAGGYAGDKLGFSSGSNANQGNFRLPNMNLSSRSDQAERERQLREAQELLEAILIAQGYGPQVKYG